MLSKYDRLPVGLITAFVVAFIGYALLLQAQDFLNSSYGYNFAFRDRSVALLALSLNLLPMNYFRKRYQSRSLRGLVIGTMILAVIWFVYYGRELLNAT